MNPFSFRISALTLLLAATSLPAVAGDHRYTLDAAYIKECGACHVAYPAALLPAPNWATVTKSLDRHYGTDASLDAKAEVAIGRWLADNASRRDKHAVEPAPGQPVRLSESPWFQKEHRRARLPVVGGKKASFAQCDACHTLAAKGDYNEGSMK